jgi:hypothetical protein
MAAGLGFRTFNTGDVLSAADTNGYLMQGVWVFADAAARDAAVTSPQEGNFAYLKDTNVTTYYTGSAWANLDTTGMTNPMTTTGDTIYSSSGSTPARLGLGTAGQVLRVNSGATAPEWGTPAGGGGLTLLSTTACSGTSTTISSISQSYKSLYGVIYGLTSSASYVEANIQLNGTGSHLTAQVINGGASQPGVWNLNEGSAIRNSGGNNAFFFEIHNYTSTTKYKPYNSSGGFIVWDGGFPARAVTQGGFYQSNTEITSITIQHTNSANGGEILLYGVN